MHLMVRWLFILLIPLTCSCTVVHIIGESGNVETRWLPGISYIHIDATERPLYVQSKTLGLGLSNKSLTLGYGVFEQVVVEDLSGGTCLLISISGDPANRDFSFQKKDPEYVCSNKEVSIH